MSYQGQCTEKYTSNWRAIANNKTKSEWENQPSLLNLLERLQARSARYTAWRYRVVSAETGEVLCQQNQDGTWPPLQQIAAVVGRRFRRS